MTTARMPGRRPADPFLAHRAAIEAEYSIPALVKFLGAAIGAAVGFVLTVLAGPQP